MSEGVGMDFQRQLIVLGCCKISTVSVGLRQDVFVHPRGELPVTCRFLIFNMSYFNLD